MKILHFAPDEKFLPFIQSTFEEVYPGANHYRVPGTPGQPLKFLQSGYSVQVVRDSYWRNSKEIRQDLASCDCLLVHFMTPEFATGLKSAPDSLLIGWVGWGGDYYHLIGKYFGNLQLPATQALVAELSANSRISLKNGIGSGLKAIFLSSITALGLLNRQSDNASASGDYTRDIVSRLDFVWINPEEMPLFERALPNFNRQYHRICYYSAEQIFSLGAEFMNGPDILLGNSATPTNNHLELFEQVEKLDLGDRILVTPLNYGDENYAEAVERVGKTKFGTRFVALRKYMPLNEYYELLGRCGTVMMNHIRQQAATTIATALYKGAKVYLRNENPVMSFYRNMGMRIWSIPDDLDSKTGIFGPLSRAEMTHNQSVLSSYWGHETALDQIRQLKILVEAKHGKIFGVANTESPEQKGA